jgi:hypothetical protein
MLSIVDPWERWSQIAALVLLVVILAAIAVGTPRYVLGRRRYWRPWLYFAKARFRQRGQPVVSGMPVPLQARADRASQQVSNGIATIVVAAEHTEWLLRLHKT